MQRSQVPRLLLAVAALGLLLTSVTGYVTRDRSDGGASLARNTVRIADFAYGPDVLRVPAGETVSWINDDQEPHTVTSDAGGPLDSGSIPGGGTYRARFETAGTFDYVCTIHPSMRGTIEVGSA